MIVDIVTIFPGLVEAVLKEFERLGKGPLSGLRLAALHVVDEEAVKRPNLDVGVRLDHFGEHFDALFHRKQALFALVLQHRHDQAVRQLAAAANQVQVPIRNRIERARIDSDNSRWRLRGHALSFKVGLILNSTRSKITEPFDGLASTSFRSTQYP